MRRVLAASLLLATCATPASAHSAARGFVLLLPTANVIAGGAMAVAASFAIVALIPAGPFRRLFEKHWRLGQVPLISPSLTRIASAMMLAALVTAGFLGTRDPLANMLPLAVWTLWWGIVVLLHPVFGNLWFWLNPIAGWCGAARGGERLPGRLSYVPALVIFAGFAWFQLVSPAPEDPARLATAVLFYAALTLIAAAGFGCAAWFGAGDPFAVFLGQLGAAAPLFRTGDEHRVLALRLPGAGLPELPALPLAGILFVLLSLSSISFDGLAGTFAWLAAGGVNPLDYPGRSALIGQNSLGLASSFAVLAALYLGCIALGSRAAQSRTPWQQLAGALVYSLIPISIAFHFAHYLPDLLVKVQYLGLAANDPFGLGWNVLGLAGYQVTASFLNTTTGVQAIYAIQTDAIILGHVAGVAVAHLIALREELPRGRTLLFELPLAALMVAYTAFGLWTLSAPSIG